MAHMVIFQGADGVPGYQQCETIEDCVKFVEELRNDRGVERARIFRMEEIEFEFRPYWFVVQHPGLATGSESPGPGQEPAASETPEASEAVAEEPATTSDADSPASASDSRDETVSPPPPLTGRGLFGRS